MMQNRVTHDIPFNEAAIANIMYKNNNVSSFLKPEDMSQQSNTGKNYAQKRPNVDYTSFGKKIKF